MAKGQKTGGRKAGTPNKATADIKAVAGQYSTEAVEMLVSLARTAQSETARVSAIKELLDRAHGKSPQALVGSNDEPALRIHQVIEQVIVDPQDRGS